MTGLNKEDDYITVDTVADIVKTWVWYLTVNTRLILTVDTVRTRDWNLAVDTVGTWVWHSTVDTVRTQVWNLTFGTDYEFVF